VTARRSVRVSSRPRLEESAAMADDPNEAARRAFGDDGPATPVPTAAHAGRTHPAVGPRDVPLRALADWWTRAGAFVLDQLVVAGIAIVAALVIAAALDDSGGDTTQVVVYAVAIPLGLLYAPLLMARAGAHNGQTLGKQVVGIRVVRVDGAPMTFWTGVLRTAVGQQLLIAITFYVYAFVDYLWPLRDPQNQALHDKLAKTWVLRTTAPDEPPPPAWLPPEESSAQGGWLPPRPPGA
jgi:uncharacterized RDD family membrane protein YckC